MFNNLEVFDAENVAEGSDYKAGENVLPPVGLPHVIVNGQFVKRDNEATNVLAGQPIRYPVEDQGRHEVASTKQWLAYFAIDDGSLAPRGQ